MLLKMAEELLFLMILISLKRNKLQDLLLLTMTQYFWYIFRLGFPYGITDSLSCFYSLILMDNLVIREETPIQFHCLYYRLFRESSFKVSVFNLKQKQGQQLFSMKELGSQSFNFMQGGMGAGSAISVVLKKYILPFLSLVTSALLQSVIYQYRYIIDTTLQMIPAKVEKLCQSTKLQDSFRLHHKMDPIKACC